MIRVTTLRRFALVLFVATLMLVASDRDVSAQGFISPFIGYNFSGDSGCPEITNCNDKRIDWGFSFGALGSIAGVEAEVGYTKNFFGETVGQTSNVLTFMGNVMLAPKFGPVQPYGVIGIGLIRTVVEATANPASGDENRIGWDGGGGVIVFFSQHVGIRGDVRYFRSFEVLDLSNFPNLPIRQGKLNYGRIAAAAVFKF
jgi:opacity protein-like surface antigen